MDEQDRPPTDDSHESDLPAASAPSEERRPLAVLARLTNPFAWAFAGTIGVLLGLALGGAAVSLSDVFVTITVSLFLALALDPPVKGLQRRGLSRGQSILIVSGCVLAVAGIGLAVVVPAAVDQVIAFARAAPGYLAALQEQAWFQSWTGGIGGSEAYAGVLARLQAWLSDPSHLLAVGGGVISLGTGLINGISGTAIVTALTLYFLVSMESMKQAFYNLLPAYRRTKAAQLTEQITTSVGAFIGGGIQQSVLNAGFSLILLALLGTPYLVLLTFICLLVTLIPMIGSILFWIIGTAFCLLDSWVSALIFAVVYLVYTQLEAYVITPRIMSKAVSVPGSLVLIGAMVGATLLGLLGALLAVPLTASLLILLKNVYVPRQDARTAPPPTADDPVPE
ncbi:MAG: AI-2E family transporter [Propionicimonas sp.]|uniref:AI-2E family transporter n=1 Tax=Propionicimonas sp. TaxID=1955623 RepID=UPI003D0B397B